MVVLLEFFIHCQVRPQTQSPSFRICCCCFLSLLLSSVLFFLVGSGRRVGKKGGVAGFRDLGICELGMIGAFRVFLGKLRLEWMVGSGRLD